MHNISKIMETLNSLELVIQPTKSRFLQSTNVKNKGFIMNSERKIGE